MGCLLSIIEFAIIIVVSIIKGLFWTIVVALALLAIAALLYAAYYAFMVHVLKRKPWKPFK